MSRIIEFMGLPGVGKSTLARGLLAELRRNWPALLANEAAVARCLRRRNDGVFRNLLKRLPCSLWKPITGSQHALAELHQFASAHPSLVGLMFDMLSSDSVSSSVRQCILYALFLHSAERQLLDSGLRAGEGALVEEGLAMGLLALMDCLPPDAPCDEHVARFVGLMPPPFGLVWIDADPLECAARLRRRPRPPLSWAECSDRELLQRLTRGRHALALTFAECERRGIRCCRIPNSERDAASAPRLLLEHTRAWAARLAEAR